MKRFLVPLFSVVLLGGLVVGCSSDNDNNAANNDTNNNVNEDVNNDANNNANNDVNNEENDVVEDTTTEVTMHRVQAAPHGDKSFATVVVVMDGDTIVGASLDEFQYLNPEQDGVVGVPNTDGGFGENFPEGSVLASKMDSDSAYSFNMAEKAGSTQPISESFAALEAFVVGKTIAELEEELANNSVEEMIDVVTSSTLVDNFGYVQAFVDAAKANSNGVVGQATSTDLKIGRVQAAPHGDKSFATVVVAMDGDIIVGASLDEFQFLNPEQDGVVGVPNTDGGFGENFPEGSVLASKMDSDSAYSANMAEKAGSTQPISESFAALEAFVVGKTIAELEDVLAKNSVEEMIDVVTSSTLVDNFGYVQSFIDAAKAAK